MNIEFTYDEISLLKNVLEERIKQLEVEIHRTEARGFRHALEQMHDKLVEINERIGAVAVS